MKNEAVKSAVVAAMKSHPAFPLHQDTRKASTGKPPKYQRKKFWKPGDLVWLMVRSVGIEPRPTCACNAMRLEMNRRGWIGSFSMRKKVWKKLKAEAAEHGILVGGSFWSLLKCYLVLVARRLNKSDQQIKKTDQ